ncbi:DHHC palmitoyltransferase-domain-containing protein [Myxozyma melibiosi]|uniref:Palmitoyltransferase n=1 Tax=Myxozyma melibiosi TaxID=54550 RepID=A0ABR1FAE9_9ASCO
MAQDVSSTPPASTRSSAAVQNQQQQEQPIGLAYAESDITHMDMQNPFSADQASEKSKRKRFSRKSLFPKPSSQLTDDEWRARRRKRYRINKCVPFILVALLGYWIYVYSYIFAYTHLIQRDHGKRRKQGIAFMTISLFYLATILCYASIVNVLGPGYVQKSWGEAFQHSLNNESAPPAMHPNIFGIEDDGPRGVQNPGQKDGKPKPCLPDAFISEPDGYPLWCSRCQLMRPDRAHHSSEVDRCVLKMDHYCPWLGSIIGLRNYKTFYLFIMNSLIFNMFSFVTITAYAVIYAREDHLVAQFVVVAVLSGIFAGLLVVFCGVHSFYLLRNQTTIEYLSRNYRIHFINIGGIDSERSEIRGVCETEMGERFWNIGVWGNWKAVMGGYVWEWFLPWNTTSNDGYSFPYSPALMNSYSERLRKQKAEEEAAMNDNLTRRTGTFVIMHNYRV